MPLDTWNLLVLNCSIQHVDSEKHNDLLTKQYLLAYYLSTHPNHPTLKNDPLPSRIRLDFTTYKSDITYLISRIVDLWSVRDEQNFLY